MLGDPPGNLSPRSSRVRLHPGPPRPPARGRARRQHLRVRRARAARPRGRPAVAQGRLPIARSLHAGPDECRPVVRRPGRGRRRHGRWHGLRGGGVPPPGVRARGDGAVLLGLADARDQRWQRPAPAGPVGRARLHRTRRARHARVHGVRRTPRDRPATTGRDRRRCSGHRPRRVRGRPDRAGQGSPGRRDRGRRGEAEGTARRVRLRRRAGPPLPHVRRRPECSRPGRDRRLLRERQWFRSPARCSSG